MKEIAEKIYNFFTGKGLNLNQTSAILGNIQQESEFNTNTTNSNSGAYGIFQWLGSRKKALENFAKEQGKKVSDLQLQLDFAWHELTGSESKSLDYLKKNSEDSVSNLTVGFESVYERSGGVGNANRVTYANEWASYFSGKDSGTANSQATGSSEEVELNLVGDIVKLITVILVIVLAVLFLLLTLKSSVKSSISVEKIVKTVDKVV